MWGMNESERTTLFLKWLKARRNENLVAECKIAKTNSLPFSAVKDHQETALYRVRHGIMNYKIPDVGRDQKPFDIFQYFQNNAYIVIFWWTKPGDKRMTIIKIDNWMEEKQKSGRKSLTYDRSCLIGECLEL